MDQYELHELIERVESALIGESPGEAIQEIVQAYDIDLMAYAEEATSE